MPSTLTYPGVYIEELPSGVRAIAGVSTSVAAFVGTAKQGPINRAIRIFSFADFERRFGGLFSTSEMSYGVRQFFLNGGSEAWIVRLALHPATASLTLANGSGQDVIIVTAKDAGSAANDLDILIENSPVGADSLFTLTVRTSSTSAEPARQETFEALSLNPDDLRFAADLDDGAGNVEPGYVSAASDLISVQLAPGALDLVKANKGKSVSGTLDPVNKIVSPTVKKLRVSANSLDPVEVTLNPAPIIAEADAGKALILLAAQIETAVRAASARPAYKAFTCQVAGSTLVMTSGEAGARSAVRVLPGTSNDAAAKLKLGSAYGGSEADAAAGLRPSSGQQRGSLESLALTDAEIGAVKFDTGDRSLLLALDAYPPLPVRIPQGTASDAAAIAVALQAAVQAARPSVPAFRDFTAAAVVTAAGGVNSTKLVLSSGTAGETSSVAVQKAGADTLADNLKLSSGAAVPGLTPQLGGGDEHEVGPGDVLSVFEGDRAARTGIYALEEVDLFNLLCLPGIADESVHAIAVSYCEERRAFALLDPPVSVEQPDAMEKLALSPSLPKNKNAAVFYPWIRIADPVKGGRSRAVAPSGSIAGLFARTDSNRGVWKAPAGTEANVLGAQGLSYLLSDPQNGILNPRAVNCLRVFPGFGVVCWGSRTLRGDNNLADEWKYIPVRRLALFLEESLYRGTKWAVFEPNDEPLWSQLRLNIGAFLHGLFIQGAFQGQTPNDAYFVRVDKTTTTPADVDLGIVNIHVGFAPLKPAEFVVLKFQQKTQQAAS